MHLANSEMFHPNFFLFVSLFNSYCLLFFIFMPAHLKVSVWVCNDCYPLKLFHGSQQYNNTSHGSNSLRSHRTLRLKTYAHPRSRSWRVGIQDRARSPLWVRPCVFQAAKDTRPWLKVANVSATSSISSWVQLSVMEVDYITTKEFNIVQTDNLIFINQNMNSNMLELKKIQD